jgi:flagellar motor switch protein FliM
MGDKFNPTTVSGSEILGHIVRPEREYTVKPYDFRRPDKFSLEQIHTVRAIHDTFARRCSPVLAGVVGSPVTVRCHAVDQMTYSEFLDSIPEISALIPISVAPLRGTMLMQIDGTLAHLFVRTSCGGGLPDQLPQPTAQLTEIERVVLRDVVDKLTTSIDEAWHNVIELSSEVVSIETEKQMVQIVPPSEMIVLGSMELSVAGATGFINFAIPYITIEPIVGRLSAQWWYGQVHSGSPVVAAGVADLHVDVELHAETLPISLADLAAVASGQPVELPSLASSVAGIRAGGIVVADVAVDPAGLGTREPLSLPVISHKTNTAALGFAGAHGGDSGLAPGLAGAVDTLSRQIREVRQAVLEIRDDRETMLAELADPTASTFAETGESELGRRHAHDIATILAGENPLIIGFIIAGLPPETAAAVLADTDPALQPDIVRSIVALSQGDRGLHRKLLSFIGRRITRSLEKSTSGGVEVVVKILNNVPRSTEKHVMETFLHEDKEFFESIAKRMFVFEDFILVDPGAIKKLMGRVSADEMALALKGIPAEVVEHIESAVEPVTLDIMRHVGGTLGPVRRQDVESAQRDIIEELRQLEEAGQVVVARPDEVIE